MCYERSLFHVIPHSRKMGLRIGNYRKTIINVKKHFPKILKSEWLIALYRCYRAPALCYVLWCLQVGDMDKEQFANGSEVAWRSEWVKVVQWCPTLCDPMDYSPWNSPGQNTGVGSLSLLQGQEWLISRVRGTNMLTFLLVSSATLPPSSRLGTSYPGLADSCSALGSEHWRSLFLFPDVHEASSLTAFQSVFRCQSR